MRENTIVKGFEDGGDDNRFVKLTKSLARRLQTCSSREKSSSQDNTHDRLVYKSIKHSRRVSSNWNPGEVCARYTMSASRCRLVEHTTNRIGIFARRIENAQSRDEIRERSGCQILLNSWYSQEVIKNSWRGGSVRHRKVQQWP